MGENSGNDDLQSRVATCFEHTFGETAIAQRVADVVRQTSKLANHLDQRSLQEATGDLLASVLQLASERSWDAEQLVDETLSRIRRRREVYNQLGRRVRVGILSGAFDPVHRGHVAISKIALNSGVVDEIWWMPCFQHVAGKQMADPEHRLAMCEIAAKDIPEVRVSDYEIRHQITADTYTLARQLASDESIDSRSVLHLIFADDHLASMHASSNLEGLRRLMPIIVVPRGALPTPPADVWYRQSPHHYVEQAVADLEVDSGEVRRRITGGDASAAEVLPRGVLPYIEQHGIYPAHDSPIRLTGPLKRGRIAVMIGSFDPPTTAQVRLVETLLSAGYESIRILPAARLRAGMVIEHADPVHRASLIDLTFGGRPRVEIDFRGLEDELAVAPTALHQAMDSQTDLWFVVPEELVSGPENKNDLRNSWEDGDKLWQEAGFIIVTDPGRSLDGQQLPPRHQVVPLEDIRQPVELRQQLARGVAVPECIPQVAAGYIRRHRLFQSVRPQQQWPVHWQRPRVRLVYDSRNEKASRLAERYRQWEDSQADFILVIGGDGTMLHAIREYWRLRLPFIGINAGHLGFLMNQKPFDSLDSLEVVSYRMPMLRTLVESTSGHVQKHLAFGDAWIERKTGQAAWFGLDVDGVNRVAKVVGDGLLVATPSGSSSYARAMGATPVPLDTQSLTIAGSNIFRPRFWRPLMMPADATVRIRTLDHSGKRPVHAFVDGVPAGIANSIEVGRSHVAAVELAFARDSDLSAKLLASLLPHESDEF